MIDTKKKLFNASCAILLCGAALAPSVAHAQSSGEKLTNTCLFPFRKLFASGPRLACISNAQCGSDQACKSGYCELNSDVIYKSKAERDGERAEKPGATNVAQATATTEQECNADRRCRIDRLKRRNQARRYQTMLGEEERAMAFQDDVAQKRADEKPRTARPFAAEFYVSFGVGLAGSYLLTDHLRLEGTFTYINAYVDAETTSGGQSIYSSGYISGWNTGGSLTYLMRTNWWTPYLSAGMVVHSGSYSSYGSFGGGFDFDFGNNSDLQSVLHLAEGRFGFDAQLKFGARARLGVLYRYPIYALAKYGPGNYDDSSRDVLTAWINSSRRIAPEFSIGWAF